MNKKMLAATLIITAWAGSINASQDIFLNIHGKKLPLKEVNILLQLDIKSMPNKPFYESIDDKKADLLTIGLERLTKVIETVLKEKEQQSAIFKNFGKEYKLFLNNINTLGKEARKAPSYKTNQFSDFKNLDAAIIKYEKAENQLLEN